MTKQNVLVRFCDFAPTNSVLYFIQIIVLEIDDFDLEEHQSCFYDYLAIKEGDCPSVDCQYYGNYYDECNGTRYCGDLTNATTEITVQQNKACLTFKSDSSVSYRGFRITAKGKSKQ